MSDPHPLGDLTVPEPGSTSAREVLSWALRSLLADLVALPAALAPEGAAREEWSAMRRLVAARLRESPGPVLSALRHPTVSVLVRVLRTRAPGDPDAGALVASLVASLAMELAHAAALDAPFRVTRVPPRVVCLPARRTLAVPPGARALVLENGAVVVEGPSASRIELDALPESHVEIRPPIALALADDNPLALNEAHPDKQGNALDLGHREPSVWRDALGDALDLVGAHLPDLRSEIDLFVQQVVPVGYDEQAHLSASFQESIGTVYMTLHPRLMTMAEAIIHEHQHNKLNALFEVDTVLENAFEPLFKSPVRPDPRPLHGILLAVHAFIPVARLYERMRDAGHPLAARPDFDERYRAILANNREGTDVLLENARCTEIGRALLDEIARHTAA